jgi:hypothetical protein
MSYRKERFRLRFRGLAKEIKNEILAVMGGTEVMQRGDVLVFEVDGATDLTQLYAALDKLQLGPEEFEVIASVVTASDNGGIDLPEYILQMVRRTRCGIGFSFVNIGTDEEESQPQRFHLQ